MAEMELKNVGLTTDADDNKENSGEIETKYGPMKYYLYGDIKNTAILTYHDIGLNHINCFAKFFNMAFQDKFFEQFCVVHIDAPGHQKDASSVKDVPYFDMDELSEQVEQLCTHLGIKSYVGLGAGAGAYVLLNHAVKYPARVQGMVMMGLSARKCGWIEWATKWINQIPYLYGSDSWWHNWFLVRWFGQKSQQANPSLMETYWREIDRTNSDNLYKYVQGFQRRTDIHPKLKDLGCRVLLLVGDSTMLEAESIEAMGHMTGKGELIRVVDTGMLVSVERPEAMVQPFKLFLNGLGYLA